MSGYGTALYGMAPVGTKHRVRVTLENRTHKTRLYLGRQDPIDGNWMEEDGNELDCPTQITPGLSRSWGTEANLATGGGVYYVFVEEVDGGQTLGGMITLFWSNPVGAPNEYKGEISPPQAADRFVLERVGHGKGDDATITWVLKDK
jgi:hypothetical protein